MFAVSTTLDITQFESLHEWLDKECPGWSYRPVGEIVRHDTIRTLRDHLSGSASVVNRKPVIARIYLSSPKDVLKFVLCWDGEIL